MKLAGSLVVAVGACSLAAAGCASVGSEPHTPARAQIRIAVATGCPASLGNARDVRNPESGLARWLVPRATAVTSGLVCRYAQSSPSGHPTLNASTSLDSSRARRIAGVIAQISLRRPRGLVDCPMDLIGAYTIIVFHYGAGPDLDLWYRRAGCQSVDNGVVGAFEVANPSFYDTFLTTYHAVVGATLTTLGS